MNWFVTIASEVISKSLHNNDFFCFYNDFFCFYSRTFFVDNDNDLWFYQHGKTHLKNSSMEMNNHSSYLYFVNDEIPSDDGNGPNIGNKMSATK